MGVDVTRAALPNGLICGAAADRIGEALGTPNVIGEKANVTSFMVRRLVWWRGLHRHGHNAEHDATGTRICAGR
ncbi:hypothetical protein [Streptomyces sp. NPDC054866]